MGSSSLSLSLTEPEVELISSSSPLLKMRMRTLAYSRSLSSIVIVLRPRSDPSLSPDTEVDLEMVALPLAVLGATEGLEEADEGAVLRMMRNV